MGELCYNCFQNKENPGACEHCGFDPAAQEGKYPLALPYNTILNGRYIIGRVLGQGGFGVTYIAQDFQTKERVAIKEYFPSDLSTRTGSYRVTPYSGQRGQDFEYGKQRFLDEAKILAEFNSDPHIVNVSRYFDEESTQTAYFVMEYVDGVSLENYVKSKGGRLSPEEANQILLPLMYSLDQIHKKNIVHRDIAPDNILLNANLSSKLIDFGAARSSTGNKSMSMDVVVKHGFAPKEQYSRHGRVGPYTDIYSMGATWYYTITGRIPPESIDRAEEDNLILPGVLGVKLPEKQLNALLKALAVRAEDRYQSMAEFAADLEFEQAPAVDPESGPVTTRENLVVRAFDYLEQENWDKADSYLNTAMDFEPENPMIYVGCLMAKLHVAKQEDLAKAEPFDQDPLYLQAIELADPALKMNLESMAVAAQVNNEHRMLGQQTQEGMNALKGSRWDAAAALFNQILQVDPQDAQAHVGLLLAENKVKEISQLAKLKTPFSDSIHYAAAINAADPETVRKLMEAKEKQEKGRKFPVWIIPVGLLAAAAIVAAFLFFQGKPDPKPPEGQQVAPTITLPAFSAEETKAEWELPTVTLFPADASKVYDGQELRASELAVDGDLNGFTVGDLVYDGAQTAVGIGESTIQSFALYDPEGRRVSDEELAASGSISLVPGRLIVKKRALKVTAVTTTLTTRGETVRAEELNTDGFTRGYMAEGLADGQHIEGDFILGSGESSFASRISDKKIRVVNQNGEDVTDCYVISTQPGKVTINVERVSLQVSDDCTVLDVIYWADTPHQSLSFAVWSDEEGQDDLFWYEQKESQDNIWEIFVDLTQHRSSGNYQVDIYSSEGGTLTKLDAGSVNVERAIIPDNHLEAERINDNTVRVTLESGLNYDKVSFPVWTYEGDQDDIVWYDGTKGSDGKWYFTFRLSDHPGSTYYIHAYDIQGDQAIFVDGLRKHWE